VENIIQIVPPSLCCVYVTAKVLVTKSPCFVCHIKHRILTHFHRELYWLSFLLGKVSKEDQKFVNSFRRDLTWKLPKVFSNRDLFNHLLVTYVPLTLCGPVANLLAFGFLNVHTGSQLFGF
jgi:hypothetical protein